MDKKICVYTCITGNYDSLHEIEQPEKNIDYYCFTNNNGLKSKTWKIVPIQNGNLDNCRLARKIKILGHPIIDQYKIAVWTDADIIWRRPISEFVKTYLKTNPLAIFRHHTRNNIRDEAIACLQLRKDDKDTILKTINYYQTIGYPNNNGLCESTVFIKDPNHPQVIKTMQVWFDMIKKYSRRDQLSFNFAIWRTKLKIDYIDLNVWDNNWFYTTRHTPHQKIQDCHAYYGNPSKEFDFNKYFIYPYQKKGNLYQFSTTIPCDTHQIEFSPCEIIGVTYRELNISPTPTQISNFGFSPCTNAQMFCTDHSTISVHGTFKTRQKLSFSIILDPPDPAKINQLIAHQWQLSDELSHTKKILKQSESENAHLTNINAELQNSLQAILNSKGWQTLEKLRKVARPHR